MIILLCIDELFDSTQICHFLCLDIYLLRELLSGMPCLPIDRVVLWLCRTNCWRGCLERLLCQLGCRGNLCLGRICCCCLMLWMRICFCLCPSGCWIFVLLCFCKCLCAIYCRNPLLYFSSCREGGIFCSLCLIGVRMSRGHLEVIHGEIEVSMSMFILKELSTIVDLPGRRKSTDRYRCFGWADLHGYPTLFHGKTLQYEKNVQHIVPWRQG